MRKIGFLGMGNMAGAMVQGFSGSGAMEKDALLAYAPNQEKLRRNGEKLGFTPCATVGQLAGASDVIVLACKPYQVEDVLREAGDGLAGKLVLSIANGWDFDHCSAILSGEVRVQYVMPSLPCAVGEGVFLLEDRGTMTPEERTWLMALLSGCGTVVELPAELIPAASAVSGCGPAFICMVAEAMADGAVMEGIPREKAYTLVEQMLTGTGKLLQQRGLHPGQLKDGVCSPGGVTIQGVAMLEQAAVRSAFIQAVVAACGKR